MRVCGIVGWKNSGKTTLVVRLVEHFSQQGLKVATIKHAHHGFDIDQPGTDSYAHRQAGARQVIVASNRRVAVMTELAQEAGQQAKPPALAQLLAQVGEVDLVLVEGFKTESQLKIHAMRETNKQPMPAEVSNIIALATDRRGLYQQTDANAGSGSVRLPVFDLDDIAGIAGFILAQVPERSANVLLDER